MAVSNYRICSMCKQSLPIEEFYRGTYTCKSCRPLQDRKYYIIHREKRVQASALWNQENKEYIAKSAAERRKLHPERTAWNDIVSGSKKRSLGPTLTKESFYTWWRSQTLQCTYCEITNEDSHTLFDKRLTVDRKDNLVGYLESNLCLACFRCNTLKRNWLTYSEMLWVGRSVLRQKWPKELEQIL